MCYLCEVTDMHVSDSLMCTNKVNCISIYSNYVISHIVNESSFIAQRFCYKITMFFYDMKGPLSHSNLCNHIAICSFLSNAQLHLLVMVFELLFDVHGALLKIADGQVNAANFMVVCEQHPQITEIILSEELILLDRLDCGGAFVQQGGLVHRLWMGNDFQGPQNAIQLA